MRDYIYRDGATGMITPVSEMPTARIERLLGEPWNNKSGQPNTAIVERLKLELFIRERRIRETLP